MTIENLDIKIVKYPDGSSYVKIPSTGYKEDFSKITYKINNYEDLWNLVQLVDALNNRNVIPEITIPNLIDAQADRRFSEYESSGLKLVCKLLNSLNANFRIFHPHNPEVVEALINNVDIFDNSNFIDEVLEDLTKTHEKLEQNTILMSSDAGGFKPLMKLCDKLKWEGKTASASKSRVWDGEKSKLIQQIQCEDFGGKNVLIIDDICVYGGTFIGLSKMLKTRNIGKLYLAVSHMTVQHFKSSELFDSFDAIFTTNSKYDNYFIPNSKGEQVKPDNLIIKKPILMIQIKSPHSIITKDDTKKIFLAGSIEQGLAEQWQPIVVNEMRALECILLNPRRDEWDNSWEQNYRNPNFYQQVYWELNALDKANLIFMYLDPATRSPISLLELGLYAKSDKLIVVCSEAFYRSGNVEIICEKYNIPLFRELSEGIQHLKN